MAIVAVIVTPLTSPKPDDELRGLVRGLGGVDLHGDTLIGDRVWYRSPILLGVIALVLAAAFYIPVF